MQICCNGKVSLPGSRASCCGSTIYNPYIDVYVVMEYYSCEVIVHRAVITSLSYDSYSHICCGGVPKVKGNATNCCGTIPYSYIITTQMYAAMEKSENEMRI